MFTKREIQYFDTAKEFSKYSNHDKYSLGAVIVKDGKILSSGFNNKKSHPLQKKYNKFRGFKNDHLNHFLHAEIHALSKVQDKNLSGSQIFVYRNMKDGNNGMSRPCKGCMQAIKDFGITDVYYSTENGLAFEKT